MKNNKLEYQMILLTKVAEWGRLNMETLKKDIWYCSGIGGVIVLNEDCFNSKHFDEYLKLAGLTRKNLILDQTNNLQIIYLPETEIFMDCLKSKNKVKIAFNKPLLRFEVLSVVEFNTRCPPKNFVSCSMVTKFYVENYCKR